MHDEISPLKIYNMAFFELLKGEKRRASTEGKEKFFSTQKSSIGEPLLTM